MTNLNNDHSSDFFIKCLAFAIKFFALYWLMGMFALLISFVCHIILSFLQGEEHWIFVLLSLENAEPIEMLPLIFEKLPFGDFLENLAAVYKMEWIGDIWKLFSGVNQKISLADFFDRLLPDVTLISLSSLIFFFFSRINYRLYNFFGELAFKIVYYFVSFFWSLASIYVSVTIVEIIRVSGDRACVYWFVLTLSILLHFYFLRKSSKASLKFIFLVIFLKDIVDAIIKSYFIWWIFNCFLQPNFLNFLFAIVTFFIFAFYSLFSFCIFGKKE